LKAILSNFGFSAAYMRETMGARSEAEHASWCF